MHVTIRLTLCALVMFALVGAGISSARGGILDGLGSVGGESSGSTPNNYPDLLQTHRGLSFGGAGLPNAFGFVGSSSTSILQPGNQIDQLVSQVQLGNVTLAIITIGDNDYINQANDIATGALSGASLAAYQAQVAANITTAVNAVRAEGAYVVLGGFADILHSPASASILANPVAADRLANALADGRTLVSNFAVANNIPFIDFYALQKEVYDNGSAQLGGVDLILSGYGSDPHYFFEDPFHAGIIVRGAITNLYIEAINQGYGTNIPLLSDQEILGFAGLSGEYESETFVQTYAYPKYVAVPEPGGLLLSGLALAAAAVVLVRPRASVRG
jgi:lysophospholipase L1-like esterase